MNAELLKGPLLAKDIMTKKVITLKLGMDVFDAIEVLLSNQISGAPVVDDDGNLLGMFTEKDCLGILVQAVYDQHPTSKIDPFVKRDLTTVDEQTDMLTIAQLFLQNSFRRVPVVRDGKKLVGLIARRDLLRAAHRVMAVVPKQENPLLYLSSLMERSESPFDK